jgi:general secretion pathway protein G
MVAGAPATAMQSDRHGFTMVELLVVMTAIALLIGIVAPRYLRHVQHAREVVLRTNLREIRGAIDGYHADRGVHPARLADLVDAHYLRKIPDDPVTERADTWILVRKSAGGSIESISDVRSGAVGNTPDGISFGDL